MVKSFEKQPHESSLGKESYFEGTSSSREFLAAKKFLENYINTGKVTLDLSDTPENIEAIQQELIRLGKRLLPGISIEGVIEELRNAKVITPPVARKKEKEPAVPEMWKSSVESGITVVGKIDLAEAQNQEVYESILTSERLEELHARAVEILGAEEIDEVYEEKIRKDFIHLYNIDEIAGDIQKIIAKEKRIKELDSPERVRLKKLATILEAMLIEGIDEYRWLGEKIKIVTPSRFDELERGVDGIIELNRNDSMNEFLALGVDVSFRSVSGDLFDQKIGGILDHIDTGELTQIKYFKDKNGNALENLHIPKVVVSVDAQTVEDLTRLWGNGDDASKDGFKNHSIAIDIIGQIAEQCKLFSVYAKKVAVYDIAKKYDEAFDLILKISQEVPRTRDALTQFKQNKFVDKIQKLITKRVISRLAA